MQKANRLRPINNKGQTVNLVIGTIVGLGVGVLVIFGILFGIAALNPVGFFTAGSDEAVATQTLLTNYTGGVSEFSNQLPQAMLVIGILLVIAAIAIFIAFVVRIRQTATSGGGGTL